MADAAQIPVIGPYLGFLGIGNKPADTTIEGTLRGRYRKIDVRSGIVSKIRPTSEVPRGLYGDLLNAAFADALGDWAAGYQERAGLTNVGPHPPVDPGPLPDPVLESPPLVANPPQINLPVDLPEIVVNPPPVSPPREIAPPAPLEVPLEAIEFDPYATGQPTVFPGARPGSAPATSSPPRINPVPTASPFPGNLLGIGAAFALAGALAPGVARDALALPSPRTRPAPAARPGATPGTPPTVVPGTPVDFLTPIVPSIVPTIGVAPGAGFSLAAQPSPQPKANQDKCKCDEKKKKESKPREARTKCFKGTFRQRAKGISYSRGEEIPCDGPLPKRSASTLKEKATQRAKGTKGRAIAAVTKYAKRGKAPKLGELARDVLGF